MEHKLAAHRYYLTRMNSLPLSKLRKQKEWNNIQYIAETNNFPDKIIQKLNQSIQKKINIHVSQSTTPKAPKKWITFTYYHPSVRLITNLFKNTDINIAFRNTNTIHNYLKVRTNNTIDQYMKNGIYKLTCTTCDCSYVGQTGRNLKQRYLEHTRYIRNNDPQSAYAAHIINNIHEYGSINNNMTLFKQANKGPHTNSLEQFYIQLHAHNKKLVPEQIPGVFNPVFRFVYNLQSLHFT
jgi:hypothetical protein